MTDLLRDRYAPIEVVGHGGEARVLKAIDRQHDRVVALKVRPITAGTDRAALLTEAGTLLRLPPNEHLPVVREDFFEADEYVVAMDWIEGTDLSRLLRINGCPGLAPSTVIGWLADAAAALTHLHTQDPPVVHGDVKPANLVLTAGGRVVLVDFGLSSAPGSTRRRGGTVGYAAPELAAGEPPSRASDVYSLAATAFALLTGAPPAGVRPTWEGIDTEQAAHLEEAIRAGLATDPDRRPTTAGAFVERLRAGWGSSLPTGVLTFCFTDIEGSSALWEADAPAMARALVRHETLVAQVMERNGGRCVQSMGEGDSTVSVFPAAADAVVAAIDLQRTLSGEPGPGVDARPMRVRAALHTGEAAPRGGTYMGATLNLTARIRGLADAGQVFLSATTAGLVHGALPAGASLVDLGPHRLRGIAHAEEVYALSAPGIDAPPAATTCPYPGLAAFERADAERFFGREVVVAEVVERVRKSSFVAIVGPSGSGKSSVLRAGLLSSWGRGRVMTPGAAPVPLPEGPDLVVVDQLEEAFTLCDDPERREQFLDSLVDRNGPVAVGLRADFYGRLTEHRALARSVAEEQVLLGPLGEDELRRAITGPAEWAGLRIEPGLVEVLVEEVLGEPGSLPLLSHALRATWENRDGRVLTLDAYRATGGVRAAVATTAEGVYRGLDPGDRQLARLVFLTLTEPGEGTEDSRRRAALTELTPVGDGARIGRLLDAMTEARLVIVDDGTAEVAHEALIRHWPRLRTWLDEDREGLRVHRRLNVAAAEWDASGRDPAELYRGTRLDGALEWSRRGGGRSALESEFLDAAVAEQERERRAQLRSTRRLRALLAGTATALVLALVAGGLAWVSQRRATDSRQEAESSRDAAAASRDRADISRIAAESRSLVDRRTDVGLLLAAAAYDLDDTAETRSTLLNALEAHPLLDGLLYGEESGLEAAVLSPDGRLIATPTSDGTGTILWDAATHQRDGDPLRAEGGGISLDAAFSPDGRFLAVPVHYYQPPGGYRSTLEVWDVGRRRLVTVAESPTGALTTTTFTADGSRLITHGGFSGREGEARDLAVEWDTATWRPVGDPWVLSGEYAGDDGFVVSAAADLAAGPRPDGSIGVWRISDRSTAGSPIAASELADPKTDSPTGLAVAPDGSMLAVSLEVGGVLLVDPMSHEILGAPLEVPESSVTAMEFSPDGATIALGRLDGRTQLHDVATGEPLGSPLAASSAEITDVTFDGEGTRLVTVSIDRTAAVWRLDGGRSFGSAPPSQGAAVTEVAFSPDGRRLLTADLDGTVAVRSARTGRVLHRVGLGGPAVSVAVGPDGQRLAAAGADGVVVLADTRGSTREEVDLSPAVPRQVVFSPDGKTVAVALGGTETDQGDSFSGPGTVRFIDPRTGDETHSAIEVGEPVIALGYSPDGDLLAVATVNNVAGFFSPTSGREVGGRLQNPDAPFTSVSFSPDGRRVALGIASGTVRQYDVATRRPVGRPLDADSQGVHGVAYSPDGTILAGTSLGFSTTRLWDVGTGLPLGATLVGGTVPYSFKTFDIQIPMASRPAFSPDGRRLATPGFPGATVVWDLDPDRWFDAACSIAGRDLTDEEWARYLPGRPRRAVCS